MLQQIRSTLSLLSLKSWQNFIEALLLLKFEKG
jgi:hypothetical protein